MPNRVAILLCTYNGQSFLSAQLDSLAAQTFTSWQLWASDDGSNDGTLDVLRHYQTLWGSDRLIIVQGPERGPAANFMSLVHNRQIDAPYFAYCDQDDVWETGKLQRAVDTIQAHQTADVTLPLLYGSRTRYIDERGTDIGLSALFAKPTGFANALVQCIAGGNTMVFNRAARIALNQLPATQDIVMHDWWTYIVVTACGGRVVYDPWPSVRYRQHPENQLGMNISLMARLYRARLLIDGRYRSWNARNVAALRCLEPLLTPESRRRLDRFCAARDGNVVTRTLAFFQSGVYRQRPLDNAALAAMSVLGRL